MIPEGGGESQKLCRFATLAFSFTSLAQTVGLARAEIKKPAQSASF